MGIDLKHLGLLSLAGENKWQDTVDLDNGGQLKPLRLESWIYLIMLLLHCTCLFPQHFPRYWLPFPSGRLLLPTNIRQETKPVPTTLLLTLASTRNNWPGFLRVPQNLSPCSYPILGSFPLSRIFTISFLGFFPSKTIFLWEPLFSTPLCLCRTLSPWFSSNLRSVCA